jgi:L-ascorbate metabolism protein UlaG (beta-lactamase superfamily)
MLFIQSVLIVGLVVPVAGAAQEKKERPSLTVTYLAHSGFMLAAGDQKILVDALTEPSAEWKFAAPSTETRQKMEQGRPPFDNLSLLLISHNHIDHHWPPSTVRFLLHNPKAVVVTTPEVRDQMKKDTHDFEKVQSRLVVPELEWKRSTVREIGGIRLEIARLKHGDDKEWPSIIYAFVFELGGKKVLYAAGTSGCFPDEYEALGYARRGIDLAFLYPDLMVRRGSEGGPELNQPGIQQLRDLIAPKVPVMMHVRPDRLPYVEMVLPELQRQIPGLVLFKHELESRTFQEDFDE